MRNLSCLLISIVLLISCNTNEKREAYDGKKITVADYFNYGDTGVQVAGIKMISIKTPVGEFKVWPKRFGNNPKI